MSRLSKAQLAGVIAVTSGAVLVISLMLDWWGLPDDLLHPPANAPKEIQFMAEAYADSGQVIAHDGFEFFEVRDVIWLITGIVAFVFGLALLLSLPAARVLGVAVGALGLVSLILVAMALISPPDFLKINEERGGSPLGLDFDLPLSRKVGGWLALAASLSITASAVLATRGPRGQAGV
ncbi:MAG: hypothetical protein QOI10_1559 [Solirubrobacterales bacterium]|jgi:hypothetical protein|nr:hypothetical protein [Solirubrobacterales bacterium]